MCLLFALLFAFTFLGPFDLLADDTTDPFVYHFPAPYSDFQIVDGSISHDKKFAAILRDIANGDEPSKNYLVALSPFQVLLELPTNAVRIEGTREGGLAVNWSKDNSAAVCVVDGKLGDEEIYVVTVAADKVVMTTDLLASLRQIVLPDFKKSGANRFNDHFDFFLEEDNAWIFNDSNQIIIDCEFTNDPRLSAEKPWTGRLTGIWDTKSGKLIDPKFIRSSRTY